jgi:TonB family protein
MEAFATYLLKSVIWLSGLALVYFLFLRNERFFLLKRIYLVSGILISFIFPLFTLHYQVALPASDISSSGIMQTGNPVIALNPFDGRESSIDYSLIFLSLYLSGILFLSFRLIRQIGSLYKTINRATISNCGKAKLIRASEFSASFSFINYVFINPSVSDAEVEEIMNHELVHVNQKHWFDLFLLELLRLFQWINPFVWIYTGYIKLNHEYLADSVALQRTSNPAIYKAALVNQLFSAPVISLSNSFNYSINKKRFDMMKKIIASPYRKLKVLFVLPVFAIVFYAFATPEYHQAVPDNNSMTFIQAPVIIVKDVKGIVRKEDGTQFAGVPILVTGTTIRAATDASGNFTLSGVPEEAFIVFSYRGYLTQVLKAEFNRTMEVKLLKDPDYKEIAVISYGDGTPGPISIRSANMTAESAPKPLIVVDGVISSKGVNEINPNEISSISVLKNKSATAVYGEKGENGVILVTTKRGGITKDTVIRDVAIVSGPETKYIPPFVQPGHTSQQRAEPLIVVDDVISTKTMSEALTEVGDQIATVTRLSEKEATEKYGEKGKNGVMEIMTLKRAKELGIKVPFKRRNPDDFPTFKGNGRGAFTDWVISQVKYPPEAIAGGIQGIVRAAYTVETDGTISNVKYKGTPSPLLGDAVLKAVQSSPKWEPAKNPEANEPYTSAVSLKFELPDKVTANVEPFVVVEQMPMYPGGESELLKFIMNNSQYPDSAKAKNIQGRVIVRFVVTTDGNVDEISVLKGVHPLLDAEAVRVIKLLTGFKPGMQGGRAVNVYYMVPVTFSLTK